MDSPEFVPDDTAPGIVRNHLLRDFGPEAAARGGELMLSAPCDPAPGSDPRPDPKGPARGRDPIDPGAVGATLGWLCCGSHFQRPTSTGS